MRTPRHFYGGAQPDPATEIAELGERAWRTYDEASALEHRFAAAGGPAYGCPPAHWQWGGSGHGGVAVRGKYAAIHDACGHLASVHHLADEAEWVFACSEPGCECLMLQSDPVTWLNRKQYERWEATR